MPFLSPHANFHGMLLNDRHEFPWISLRPLEYEDPITGRLFVVPINFRTDGSSVPKALMMLPPLAMSIFGGGVWLGFREGVLHDYLLRFGIVPPAVAHRIFRTALYEAGYDPAMCEIYYAAVCMANP
jgi:hypothetical protein